LTDSHIEHFVPQELQSDLALEYGNLHASCIREHSPDLPLHCGHAKSSELDRQRSISPLDPGCEKRFLYSLDGEVIAAVEQDGNATYMIGLLKLDNPSLQVRRRAALAGAFTVDFVGTATPDELVALREAARARNRDGRFRSFAHVVARYAEQLVQS
jgi:uncharacterized protein (TIGR02646 family)